ncbi:uncharacterized protein LOC114121960 [Aphis gossypii]|uniref:uncharacterized protein LOC114121960 n=1 Tax=Aphis gossypii TaxID=80765 RepID=UPI002159B20E|nr:uncharacterized protein LOC114121960 [Aphis gossypii]
MLSIYSVIKPPKTGNCTVNEESIPIISLSDLKEIIKDPANSSERIIKITKLKEKIDMIVQEDCWDLDDVLLEHNYADSTVFDCIVYFLAGYIAKRLVHKTKCEMCIRGLKTLNTSSQDCIGKEADLIRAKSKGYLTYPESNLFIIIKHIENCFAIHANSSNVFEDTFNEFFQLNTRLKFACTNSEHKTDMLTNIFTY